MSRLLLGKAPCLASFLATTHQCPVPAPGHASHPTDTPRPRYLPYNSHQYLLSHIAPDYRKKCTPPDKALPAKHGKPRWYKHPAMPNERPHHLAWLVA